MCCHRDLFYQSINKKIDVVLSRSREEVLIQNILSDVNSSIEQIVKNLIISRLLNVSEIIVKF